MPRLTAQEQGAILLVVAVFVTGALVRAWRESRRPAVPATIVSQDSHAQDRF